MVRVRWWMGGLIGWFMVICNLHRVHPILEVETFVYVLACAIAILTVAWTPSRPAQQISIVLGSFALLFASELATGSTIADAPWIQTLLAPCMLIVTFFLARKVGIDGRQIEEGIQQVAAYQYASQAMTYEAMEPTFYREVKRARRAERPLTLVALEPIWPAAERNTKELVGEMQERFARHWMEGEIIKVLRGAVREEDIVARRNGRFLVLLCHTDGRDATKAVRKLIGRVREAFGVGMRAAQASFPDQELTLIGLMEKVEASLVSVSEEVQVHDVPVPTRTEGALLTAGRV